MNFIASSVTATFAFGTAIFYCFSRKNITLKKSLATIFAFFITALTISAQQKFTISGSIKDAKSGESIIGASVVNKEAPSVGTVSNDYGFYSLTLKEGNYKIAVAFLGYETQVLDVKLDKNQLINVSLNDQSTALDLLRNLMHHRTKFRRSLRLGFFDEFNDFVQLRLCGNWPQKNAFGIIEDSKPNRIALLDA